VQVLHPPQEFERPPFWNGWSYGIKVWHRGHFHWHNPLLNFIKSPIGLKVIRDTQTDRQNGDIISLAFLLTEVMLKICKMWLKSQVKNSHYTFTLEIAENTFLNLLFSLKLSNHPLSITICVRGPWANCGRWCVLYSTHTFLVILCHYVISDNRKHVLLMLVVPVVVRKPRIRVRVADERLE